MFAPKAGAELALAPNIAGPGPAAAEAPPKEKLLVPAGHTKKGVEHVTPVKSAMP